mmetsp:Transcript_16392/g.49132  ORF Transcript_16392/g.49132 Transcript_16392/m.49132 type:complete len:285 (+) Transcript_16392:1604-2458(+)
MMTQARPSASTSSDSLKSCCVMPSTASMTRATTSQRRMARKARSTDRPSAPSGDDLMATRLRMPAVSMSLNFRPSGSLTSVSMASRVVPRMLLTMDLSLPVMALTRLLLPTLGRPTMATAISDLSTSSSSALGGGGSALTRASMRSPVPVPLMALMAMGEWPSAQKSAACSSALPTFSHLFTARMTGFLGCVLRSQDTTSSSAPVIPVWPSTTNMRTFASSIPAAACLSIAVGSSTEEISRMALLCCASGSLAASDIRPPVSIMTNSRSPQEARMYSRSRVTPA